MRRGINASTIKISAHALMRIKQRQIKCWSDSSQLQTMVNNIPYYGRCLNFCHEYGISYYPSKKTQKYLLYIIQEYCNGFKKVRFYLYKNYLWLLNNDETLLITMYPVISYEDWLKILN